MNNNLQVLTFLYHEVTDDPANTGFQRKQALPYKHKVEEFEKNIDIIVGNSDLITTTNDLGKLNGKKRVTLISFDDGGKSAMLSAEYLERHNLRGHFFITTELIGDKYFLREDEILELHRRGHVIGSHSHSHPNVFSSLSFEEMLEEWSKSKRILEDLLDGPVTTCSIPGGDANKNAYRAALQCGYEVIFDSEPTTKPRKIGNSLILGRVCPKRGTSYNEIEALSQFRGIRKQYLVRAMKKTIKFVLYPLYSRIYNRRTHAG